MALRLLFLMIISFGIFEVANAQSQESSIGEVEIQLDKLDAEKRAVVEAERLEELRLIKEAELRQQERERVFKEEDRVQREEHERKNKEKELNRSSIMVSEERAKEMINQSKKKLN